MPFWYGISTGYLYVIGFITICVLLLSLIKNKMRPFYIITYCLI